MGGIRSWRTTRRGFISVMQRRYGSEFRLNAIVDAGDQFVDFKKGQDDRLDLSAMEKELQMLTPYLARRMVRTKAALAAAAALAASRYTSPGCFVQILSDINILDDGFRWHKDEKSQILVGVRQATQQQRVLSSAVLSTDSMHIGVLAAAAHAASSGGLFTIYTTNLGRHSFRRKSLHAMNGTPNPY